MTVWTSTQMPFLVRGMLAGAVRPAETRACASSARPSAAASASRCSCSSRRRSSPRSRAASGAPVKWVEDRYEAAGRGGHAKEVVLRARAGDSTSDGTFLALQGHYVGDGGAYLAHPWTSLIDPLCAASFLPGLYDVQTVRYEVDAPFTNKCQSRRLPRRRLDAGTGGARGADRRRGARARHRSARAAAAQHHSGRQPTAPDRLQLRRRQLRRSIRRARRARSATTSCASGRASCARKGASSASASAPSSSRAPGPARSPPPRASRASTTSTP